MISLIVPHIISLSLSHLIGEDIDAEEVNDLLDITHWQLEKVELDHQSLTLLDCG